MIYSVDTLFLIDMLFKYRYFPVMNYGLPVYKKKLIKKYYLRNGFYFDLLSNFPTEIFLIWVPIGALPLLRLNRVLRIAFKLPDYLTQVENLVSLRYNLSTAVRRLLNLFIIIFFCCHWFSCLFVFMARMSMSKGEPNWITADMYVFMLYMLSLLL
jgi:hypothetical protein